MVVEDEESIREIYGDYLSEYDVALFANATDSLAKITEVNPELLIVDLGLPDMDGIVFIEKIRATFSQKLPVIIISGRIDIEYCIQANGQGVTDLITKPFDKTQLTDLVKRTLPPLA